MGGDQTSFPPGSLLFSSPGAKKRDPFPSTLLPPLTNTPYNTRQTTLTIVYLSHIKKACWPVIFDLLAKNTRLSVSTGLTSGTPRRICFGKRSYSFSYLLRNFFTLYSTTTNSKTSYFTLQLQGIIASRKKKHQRYLYTSLLEVLGKDVFSMLLFFGVGW